ncbi:VanW family protein [Xylanimonas cellulosilytica DSM 15894]|uniref:VanW family protein n=1 Tax=Xylanimonas cellulosilytica (strain DSM 15894 / JCM 12276 / CECT 5975 / KCTC 9989 / LMG 20990 / NBRC 107835 / XIL07) TaxID=446471 RepID=D1BYS1_XYLCX|nr:VanW family protein [Xylanimonas cellulosilytica]ACZ29996.1 VanW family protein [Xylanimonas cellulosilytica DSM 15894]
MGQPTERDNAPEPNTSGSADAPAPQTPAADAPAPEAPAAGKPPAEPPAEPSAAEPPAEPSAASKPSAEAPAAGPSVLDPEEAEVPYVPPVRAYERPRISYRPPTETVSPATQALPVVVGQVAMPASAQRATPVAATRPTTPTPYPGAVGRPGADETTRLPVTPPVVHPPAATFAGTPLGTVTAPGADPSGLGGAGTDHPLGGLVGDGQPSRAPRALLMVGGVVVVLAGLFTGAQWFYADKVPADTHVAGVDIGGLSTAEAVDQLTAGLAPRAREPMQITAGEAQTTLDPAAAGLALDAEGTVAQLTGFSMSPGRLWSHLVGGTDVDPVLAVDRTVLDEAVAGLVEGLAVAPVDGTVAFTDGVPVATPAVDGSMVSAEAATEVLTTQWLAQPGPYDLPTEPVAPEITQEETDAALAKAQQIVAGPVTVQVGDQHPELPAETLAAVTSFQPVDGDLQVTLDGAALVTGVVDRTMDLLTEPDDAHFEFQGGRPVIVGGEPGTTLDPAAVATAVQTAALGTDRTAPVELVQRDPDQTRAALEALGVTEVVSTFSTPLTREPVRTENLRRGAELVTGTLIRPGETFSLIDTLSPIDASNGFRAAGVINNGIHTEGMGGGLSQMATTTYNAGFFAGFEDVEHRPHTVHFQRYPAGREATIFVGSLDMRFKNTSPYGAVMQSWISDGQLHVQVWSTKHFRVETSASSRRNLAPTTTVYSTNANCAAYPGGEGGFSITNYRKVYDPADTLVIDESYTWTYRPDNPVVCSAPPGQEPADDSAGGQ